MWELRKRWNWLCLRVLERLGLYKRMDNSDLNELLRKATKIAEQKPTPTNERKQNGIP